MTVTFLVFSTNSEGSDEMQLYAAFHLGLHCLPKYHYRVSSIQRVKHIYMEEEFWNSNQKLGGFT